VGLVPRLVDYGDPNEHPDFYDPKYRFEASHLDQRATSLFAKKLVTDLLQIWSNP